MSNINKLCVVSDWNEVAVPFHIANLPYSVESLERLLGTTFQQYVEDGLGECYCAYLEYEEHPIFIRGYMDKTSADIGVDLFIRSFEPTPMFIKEFAKSILGLSDNALLGFNIPKLPTWQVFRLDDNNNEIKMKTFHEKDVAEGYARMFASRGHKQSYFLVHEAVKEDVTQEYIGQNTSAHIAAG